MKTILIAGGAGFIGSHLSKKLLEEGNRVICVDNLITGAEENIAPLQKSSDFTFIEADVTTSLPDFTEKIDNIYHLASPASPNQNSPKSYVNFPIETLMANSMGTKKLLDLAFTHNSRFLFASTSEVYGDPSVSPQPEEYWGNVNPNGIRSVYDEGKRFGESITMTFFRKFKLDTRIIRIFNTYGPQMQKDDGRVVSNFIVQALENKPITVYGDGSQTRSFCYISDMVKGMKALMEKDGLAGEVVNIGNPTEYTISEIAEKVKELTNSSSEITYESLPPDDPLQRKPDISKAFKLLEFKPDVDLVTGLKATIEYFKSV